MSYWMDFDIDKTIHDFDYTRRAAVRMNEVIDSEDFADMDAEMIFNYISKQMNIVLFPDFLKRYIYEKVGIDAPFSEVPDSYYLDIISSSFEYNDAPYSLTPTSTKRTATFKSWLNNAAVKRGVVFTLGFGLKMKPEDVSEFLMKVLQEEDFDFTNPKETIYWFCYTNSLPYAEAVDLLQQYEKLQPGSYSEKKWISMSASPEIYLMTKENLETYLSILKSKGLADHKKNIAFEEFLSLYEQGRKVLADLFNQDAMIDGRQEYRQEDISPADFEKVLCSGIPVNKSGNLQKMSSSIFCSLFKLKRMSRQRITGILNRQHAVERFDLITLLFFIYAETVEPDWPAERYLKFIDGVNELLERCGMHGIYPVNPYEAFVLMCIVADSPLDVYAEIWEKSYGA